MAKPRKHVFVCINERPPDSPKGCCAARGGLELVRLFKEQVRDRGLIGEIKITRARCLGPCEQGANVVVYPEGVWYCQVKPEDVDEIFADHLLGNKPVERLMNPTMV